MVGTQLRRPGCKHGSQLCRPGCEHESVRVSVRARARVRYVDLVMSTILTLTDYTVTLGMMMLTLSPTSILILIPDQIR